MCSFLPLEWSSIFSSQYLPKYKYWLHQQLEYPACQDCLAHLAADPSPLTSLLSTQHFVYTPYNSSRPGRGLWCSGWSCLFGKTEMAGSKPTLAVKLKQNVSSLFPWPRGSVLSLRPPGLEFRTLCLEGSVISFTSPSSGGSPGPV